jgi:hypothetical protein
LDRSSRHAPVTQAVGRTAQQGCRMQKITVEITAKGYTGLTAENIEKALSHYFGSPTLHVSFSVSEAAQQSGQRTVSLDLKPQKEGKR